MDLPRSARSPLTFGLAALALLAAAAVPNMPCSTDARVVTASAFSGEQAPMESVTLNLRDASPDQVRALLRTLPGGELVLPSVPDGELGTISVIAHRPLSPAQALFTIEQALERLTFYRTDITAYVSTRTEFEGDSLLEGNSQRRDIAVFQDRAKNYVIAVGPTGRMKAVMARDQSRKAQKQRSGCKMKR